MKLLIAAPKRAATSTQMILEEAKELFKEVKLVPLKEISSEIPQRFKIKHEETNFLDYDYLLPRIDSKRASFAYQIMKVLDFHNMKTRRHGNHIFAELHLSVHGSLSVKEAHDLTDHLEEELMKDQPNIHLTIHVEPAPE